MYSARIGRTAASRCPPRDGKSVVTLYEYVTLMCCMHGHLTALMTSIDKVLRLLPWSFYPDGTLL